MDVNYYLHREQVERMRAARADNARARAAHSDMADLYHARLIAYREQVAPGEALLIAVPTG